MEKAVKFRKYSFDRRLRSMLRVDFGRLMKSRLFYIVLSCALLVPVLMTVMMTMMDGSESVNPQTGEITVIHGPESAWQSIGTLPTEGGDAMGGMDVMAMCNINMMFMGVSAFICLFISDDFRSGYAKNLFTVRAKKSEYVISKTLSGFVCGALMLILYFVGTLLGGAVSGLSFEMTGFHFGNLVMCLLSKIFLMLVFVAIFVLVSVSAKQKAWLSVCGSLGAGMLLFMTVGMITPLNAGIVNVLLCLAGGLMFAFGLGYASCAVLNKTRLV